jgi:MtN3 and saliva related transmembrane protein
MENNLITFIGLLAGTCTTISFFPQIRKIYRTRRTRDLSLPTYVLLDMGLLLWVVYGVALHQIAVIIPNLIIFVLNSYIIVMKLKYG